MKMLYVTSIVYPSKLANRIQVLSMGKAFYSILKNDFCLGGSDIKDVHEIPIKNFGKSNSVILAIKYIRFIQNNDFKIIYSREERLLFFIFAFYSLFGNRNKEFIFEVHSVLEKPGIILHFLLKRSTKIVTISHGLKNKLTEFGVNDTKILVAPDGVFVDDFSVKESKFEVRKKLHLPLDKKIILYSGSLGQYHSWKGFDVLLQVAREIKNEEYLFVFVGGEDGEVEKFQEEYQDYKNIFFLGHKPHSEIPYYLHAADILVLPNKKGNKNSEYYTSPMKLFEYMASGTPIIASDLPAIREILEDNRNAKLFRPGDAGNLLEKIFGICENPKGGNMYAAVALKNVNTFSWDSRALKILKFANIAQYENK